jgi:hypothetical protein
VSPNGLIIHDDVMLISNNTYNYGDMEADCESNIVMASLMPRGGMPPESSEDEMMRPLSSEDEAFPVEVADSFDEMPTLMTQFQESFLQYGFFPETALREPTDEEIAGLINQTVLFFTGE